MVVWKEFFGREVVAVAAIVHWFWWSFSANQLNLFGDYVIHILEIW